VSKFAVSGSSSAQVGTAEVLGGPYAAEGQWMVAAEMVMLILKGIVVVTVVLLHGTWQEMESEN
jgi:hypothetical protein